MFEPDPKRVVVLMGGWTSEAAVSRVSAAFCAKAARGAGWDAIEVEFDRDIQTRLKEINPSRVYNALHGQIGEDGSVQGLLNIMGIPYTHSGVVASAVAMNKVISRQLFRTAGIAVPQRLTLNEDNGLLQVQDYDGDYVVKPVNEGSSFGVQIIKQGSTPPSHDLWAIGTQLFAEAYIPGRELTVSVLDGTALGVTEITTDEAFYDFDAKYKHGGSKHILPADIPKEIEAQALSWAESAFHLLGCRGVARADYRYDETKQQLYMLEVNTQPGMTATSLVPEQALWRGISGEELVNHLLEIAQCDD
ncbi:MAG: D-alanine--D-alanine ligase [Candidatus Puniceispirillaceae bacterium]